MKKSKILVTLFASALLFTACTPTNQNSKVPFAPGSQPSANLYAFQAATSIGLLGNLNTETAGPMVRAAKEEAEEKAITDEIIKYLPSVEGALSGMDSLTSAKEQVSDREGYASMMSISYKDIALKDNSFIMYFNETPIVDEDEENQDQGTPETGTPDAGNPDAGTPETGTPDAGTPDTGTPDTENTDNNTDLAPLNAKEDDDEDEAEEEDTEIETQLDGIIVVGDKEYTMTGSKEKDPVDNEMEVSFEYHIDETTIVTVEQEIENGETEFEYEIEANGKTIYEYSIEIEQDEVELEVKEAGVGKSKYGFEIVEKDGKSLIKAEYKNGKDKVTYTFEKTVAEDGTVTYTIVE